MDHLHPDDIILTGARQRKKNSEPISCPVCGVTVRPAEMEHHYAVEVDRLHKVYTVGGGKSTTTKSKSSPKQQHTQQMIAGCSSSTTTATSSSSPGTVAATASGTNSVATTAAATEPIDAKECWNTYQRIKNNRQARLKIKSRKRKADDSVCPVCNETTNEDINVHVEMCLRRNEGSNGTTANNHDDVDNDDDDDDESIDVEVESFEEYEWAGQTRIRASSMLEGGYSATGIGTVIQNVVHADDEEDLNVDVIEPYGQPQYTEHDVIDPATVSKKKRTENLYLRSLIAGGQECSLNNSSSRTMVDDENGSADVASATLTNGGVRSDENASSNGCGSMDLTHESKNKIIDALKLRIREFKQPRSQKLKCLICIDEYRVPVVSICCWHVHCEECWLRTLGARKLCPQCNMITSPTDLRRIYM